MLNKLDSFHYEMDKWMKFLKKSSNVGQVRKPQKMVDLTLNWWCLNQIFSKLIHKIIAIEKIRIEKNGGR